MTWNNPIENVLWYATLPAVAFITASGPNYVLKMGNQTFQASSFQECDAQYKAWCIASMVSPFPVMPQLPEFSLPTDGELVAGKRVSGGYFFGTWSTSDQTVAQSSATVPLSDIAAWTPLPSS